MRVSTSTHSRAVFLLVITVLSLLLSITAGCVTARDAGNAASGAVEQQNQRQERLHEENEIINSSSQVGQH